jgi:flagellar biosynthesis protein FlhB
LADANKTEKPTQRRRQKARDKGQVARTRDLSSILGLTAAVAVLGWQASSAATEWRGLLGSSLDMSVHDGILPNSAVLFWAQWEVVRWAFPAMLAALAVSALAGVAQGGLVFAPEALAPSLERLSPATRLQQMFSIASINGLVKSIPTVVCMIYIAVAAFKDHWAQVIRTSNVTLASSTRLTLAIAFDIGWKSVVALVALAGVDYLLTWRKQESDLKMSREELREDLKETEGHPTIKGRIRRLQRQAKRRQTIAETKTATVVVTNPTHFAVALRYQPDMPAPVVVAKGRDKLAEEMKGIARWSGIPIMENPPLAQALFRAVEVGQEIPAKLYAAVAEILAVVYRAQTRARQTLNPRLKQ